MAAREDELSPDGGVLRYEAQPRSITAAARRIEPGNKEDLAHIPKKSEKWQDEAWAYYDAIPEIKFAGRFNGNALSRLRLYPAVIFDKDQPPVPIQDAAGQDGISAKLAADADDEHSRLDESESGVAGMMHEFGVDLTISGDSYLVGRRATSTEDESWSVYAESAITKMPDGVGFREKPGQRPVLLPPDTFVARIWRRHSRWPGLADSNLRSILSECEELLIASRQFRAVMKSRNNAGLLFLSSKLSLPRPVDPAKPGELDPFEASFMASMITPTHDDSSASSVVPHIVRGDGKPEELIKHFPLDRKIDESAIARVAFLIQRLAHGLDTPVEILTGIADVNHWNAWQIEDQSYKTHLEPLARVPASGLAATFLRPALLERGNPVEQVSRVVYAVDSSDLTVRPNRSVDAKDAFDRMAISFDAYRSHMSFGDDEAPSPEEMEFRATIGLGLFHRSGIATPGETIPGLPSSGDGASGGAAASIMQALGLIPRERIAISSPAVIDASATPVRSRTEVAAVGQRLADIELRLRDRLQSSSSETMRTVLQRAGSRLKSRAQGNPVLRAMVKRLAPSEVAAALGEDQTITAAGGDMGTIIDVDSFADCGDEFDTWTRQAQDQVIRVLRAAATDDAAADAAVDRYQRNQDSNRTAAREAFVASLLLLANRRLFSPDGSPDLGEFDARLSVPAGLVRGALALAGGSKSPNGRPSETPGDTDLGIAGGVALGPDAIDAAGTIGLTYDSMIWTVGWPTRPFEPHSDLDGIVFTDWDDEQLAYDGWPADENGGLLFPGDHDGCMCVAMPIFTEETDAG